MDAEELGCRLRVAREALGLNQLAVAEALALPRTAVTQWEKGNRAVSTLELVKLSRLYLRPVADFLQEDPPDEDALVALYRQAPGLEQDPSTREQVARCVLLWREGAFLRDLLGANSQPVLPRYETPVPRSVAEAVAQGEEAAMQERRRLGVGNAPIADIAGLIARQGIWASEVDLPDGISGLFLCRPDTGLAILVNASHSRGRKRFSHAHEYGHALLDRERGATVSSTDNASDLVERRANAFAAAFLMPKTGVNDALRCLGKGVPSRQEHVVFDAASGGCFEAKIRSPAGANRITCTDVAILARDFGAGYPATLCRLKSLRHISRAEYPKLSGQEDLGRAYLKVLSMPRETGERGQPQHPGRELRSQVTRLAIDAYRRAEISRGRVLELSDALGIDGETLLRLAESVREE